MIRGGRFAEQAPAEGDSVPDGLEGVGIKLLGHQANALPGFAIILHDVVAGGVHFAIGEVHNATDNADQCGLAGAVRAEQGEDLSPLDVEVDVVEGPETIRIDFVEVLDGDVRLHWLVLLVVNQSAVFSHDR